MKPNIAVWCLDNELHAGDERTKMLGCGKRVGTESITSYTKVFWDGRGLKRCKRCTKWLKTRT